MLLMPTAIDDPRRYIHRSEPPPLARELHDHVVGPSGDTFETVAEGTDLVSERHDQQALASADIELRAFLARLLGWKPDRTTVVDRAHRSIRLAADRHAALVLCGK